MPFDLSQFTDPGLDEQMGQQPDMSPGIQQMLAQMQQQGMAPLMQPPPQAPPDPMAEEDDLPKLIQKIVKRANDREERAKQLRAQTPAMIQQQMAEQFYGKPATSTLGKVGQGALQFISGAFGTAPNFTKPALERYVAQQKALNDEDAGESKAAVAEIAGYAKNKATAQQAAKAEADNRTKMAIATMNNAMQEHRTSEKVLMDTARANNLDANTTLTLVKANNERTLGQYNTLLGALKITGDPAAKAEALRAMGLPEQADEYMRLYTGVQTTNAALKQATGGAGGGTTTSVTSAPEKNVQTVGGLEIKDYSPKPETVTTRTKGGGGPQIPLDPNAAINALNPNAAPPMAAPAPAPGPLAPRPPMGSQPPLAPQAQVAPPTGNLLTSNIDERLRLPIDHPMRAELPGTTRKAPESQYMKAYYDMPEGRTFGGINVKLSPSQQTKMRDENNFSTSLGQMRSLVENAYIDGSYEKQLGLGNRLLSLVGAGDLTNKINRAFSSGKISDAGTDKDVLEAMAYTGTTDVVANKLKALSGSQVAHQEFQRISPMFSSTLDKPTYALATTYFNQIRAAVAMKLDRMGLLTDGGTQLDWTPLQQAVKDYVKTVQNKKMARPDKRDQYDTSQFLDADRIAADVARPLLGKDATMGGVLKTNKDGLPIRIIIPPKGPVDVKGSDAERKVRQRIEEMRKKRGVPQAALGMPEEEQLADAG